MPDQRDDDDHPVPPIKVMRKRLNGVYQADTGFSGPTRRYVLIVALLVGLASLPTLAAITAGSRELSEGRTDTMDIPFLPPASSGPVQQQPSVLPTQLPSAEPDPSVEPDPDALGGTAQGAAQSADAAVRAGRLIGQAGKRKPATTGTHGGRKATTKTRVDDSRGSSPRAGRKPGGSSRDDSDSTGGSRDEPAHWGRKPFVPGLPSVPADESVDAEPPPPRKPVVPDLPDVPDDPDPSDEPEPDPVDEPADEDQASDEDDDESDDQSRWCEESKPSGKTHRSEARHRSRDRSEHSRRSAVAERSNNIRPTSILERSYANSGSHTHRLIPEARSEENQIANRSYRGSHRAGSLHHADDQTAAQQRSSRVGRHHAEHNDDSSHRW